MGLTAVKSTISTAVNSLELYKGQSLDIDLYVTDFELDTISNRMIEVAFNLSDCTIFFTVRREVDSPQDVLAKVSTDLSQITINSDPTTGRAIIAIEADDTILLSAGKYVYDVWVEHVSGRRFPAVIPSDLILRAAPTRFGNQA